MLSVFTCSISITTCVNSVYIPYIRKPRRTCACVTVNRLSSTSNFSNMKPLAQVSRLQESAAGRQLRKGNYQWPLASGPSNTFSLSSWYVKATGQVAAIFWGHQPHSWVMMGVLRGVQEWRTQAVEKKLSTPRELFNLCIAFGKKQLVIDFTEFHVNHWWSWTS